MKKQKLLRALTALSVALILTISCLAVGVSADTTVAAGTTAAPAETSTPAESGEETKDAVTTTASTTTATTTEHTHDDEKEEEKSYLNLIVTLVVVVIIVAVALIYYFKNPEKVQKFWKGYKGELKKIVWLPKDELKRNTIVVCVIVVITVVLIALLDLVFSNVVWFLMDLFIK